MVKKILLALGVFLVLVLLTFVWQLIAGIKPANKSAQELPEIKIKGNVFSVEIADDPAEQARGLSGRESLAEDRGMLFLFETPEIQNFWMKGMNFPLDIIWIRGEKIVGFAESVPSDNSQAPIIYSSPGPVDKVLEINAGLVKKLGMKTDDKIEL